MVIRSNELNSTMMEDNLEVTVQSMESSLQEVDRVTLSAFSADGILQKLKYPYQTPSASANAIQRAMELLRTSHMRVYEVAEAVGYRNSKYYYQLFKQITGMRPREFYESS